MNFDDYSLGCQRTESHKTTIPVGMRRNNVLDDLEMFVAAGEHASKNKRRIFYREDDEGETIADPATMRILHAVYGLQDEVSEIADNVRNALALRQKVDNVNIGEESGDMLYYMAVLLSAANQNFLSVLNANLLKLQARYGDEFSTEKASNRDLDTERSILEEELK